jgi:hypothetical protein
MRKPNFSCASASPMPNSKYLRCIVKTMISDASAAQFKTVQHDQGTGVHFARCPTTQYLPRSVR